MTISRSHRAVILFTSAAALAIAVLVVLMMVSYRKISDIAANHRMGDGVEAAQKAGMYASVSENSDGTTTTHIFYDYLFWRWEFQMNSSENIGEGLLHPKKTSVDLLLFGAWRITIREVPDFVE